MNRMIRHLALSAALLVLLAASAPPGLSPDLLAALDPTFQAEALCDPRRSPMNPTRALLAAAAVAQPTSAAAGVPFLPDLAATPLPPTLAPSSKADARLWFTQGLMLSYGFNHAGAVASFRRAQAIDPNCALCWWGEAMALGPNINAPMDGRDRPAALAALARALALKETASPKGQSLIAALATRYSYDETADRAALDAAYADAMLAVAARYPDDDEIAVLAAEAVMDTSPWNYWLADGKPVGKSGEAVRLLEGVLKRNPGHVQAAHLYIHMLELPDPARAEAAADRLAASPNVQAAAHLVHMPAHVWHRRGRYQDSIRANIAAARADERWIAATNDQGMVRYAYYPHNVHFIVTSAMMAGDVATTKAEAMRLGRLLSPDMSAQFGTAQAVEAAPFQVMAMVGEPDAILAMPAPDARLPYALAMRHFARAVAFAQTRDKVGFDGEVKAMVALADHPGTKDLVAQSVPLPDLIRIAEGVARGRWAMLNGHHAEAVARFRAAAAIEATIVYMEPSFWHYPVSQSLGAALLMAGDAAGAAQAFRATLVQTPRNGWALYGLALSEKAAGHKAEAAAAEAAFRRAWAGDPKWLKLERL